MSPATDALDAPASSDAHAAATSGSPLPLLAVAESGPARRKKVWCGDLQCIDHPSNTVFTCAVDAAVLRAARATFEALQPESSKGRVLLSKKQKLRFHVERPPWKSDIRWISAAEPRTLHEFFAPLFARLRLPEVFGSVGEMVLFSGYFVARQETRRSHFHEDFGDTGCRAFTLMTPLYDMSALPDCHLLCEREESLHQYRYELGRAVVFGDRFVHATQTGKAPQPLAFLCFTFGDRRMTPGQWENAEFYIKNQAPFYFDPNGKLVESTERFCQ